MVEFILNHPATTDYEWQLKNHLNYANFLKQPLTISMFVPCDDEGNVLEEPENYNVYVNDIKHYLSDTNCNLYHESKSKVLFEGFKVGKNYEGRKVLLREDRNQVYSYLEDYGERFVFNHPREAIYVEDLVIQNIAMSLELSETALKRIYGC